MKPFSILVGILLFSISASSTAQASPTLTWDELEAGMSVKLLAPLNVLDFSLPKNAPFTITDSNTIDSGVQEVDAHFEPCTDAMQTRQMDLQMVDANYGFELNTGCNVSLYLELTDYYKASYFSNRKK